MPPLNQIVHLPKPVFPQQRKRTTTVTCDEVPASYRVEGLRPHEFPVVGLVVHPRIIPGFSYRVRPLTTSKYLFNGRALQLLSIGQGYGKRITFKADVGKKNGNANFFWSDSRPEGFGFEVEVVSPGDKFTIYDISHKRIGTCEVLHNKEAQTEKSHLMWPDGTIEKWVVVKLKCNIQLEEGPVVVGCVSGMAIASKTHNSQNATLMRIMNANLSLHKTKTVLTLMPGVDTHTRRITVSGASIHDIPVTYVISGLLGHEFPVIGTFVDSRILPGFHYVVRPAQAKNPLFDGVPLKLLSIGRGYGKRFTFDSRSRNDNEHFFWSDSYPEGFGFAPQEVFPGHRFKIFSGEEQLGVAHVKKSTKPQVEIEMVLLPGGGVLKRLRIEVICCITVGNVITRSCRVCGTAIVVRRGPNGPAIVEKIEAPGIDTQQTSNLRHIPGELAFVAFQHQKYLKDEPN